MPNNWCRISWSLRLGRRKVSLIPRFLRLGLPHFGGQSDKGQFKFDWALIVQGGM